MTSLSVNANEVRVKETSIDVIIDRLLDDNQKILDAITDRDWVEDMGEDFQDSLRAIRDLPLDEGLMDGHDPKLSTRDDTFPCIVVNDRGLAMGVSMVKTGVFSINLLRKYTRRGHQGLGISRTSVGVQGHPILISNYKGLLVPNNCSFDIVATFNVETNKMEVLPVNESLEVIAPLLKLLNDSEASVLKVADEAYEYLRSEDANMVDFHKGEWTDSAYMKESLAISLKIDPTLEKEQAAWEGIMSVFNNSDKDVKTTLQECFSLMDSPEWRKENVYGKDDWTIASNLREPVQKMINTLVGE